MIEKEEPRKASILVVKASNLQASRVSVRDKQSLITSLFRQQRKTKRICSIINSNKPLSSDIVKNDSLIALFKIYSIQFLLSLLTWNPKPISSVFPVLFTFFLLDSLKLSPVSFCSGSTSN